MKHSFHINLLKDLEISWEYFKKGEWKKLGYKIFAKIQTRSIRSRIESHLEADELDEASRLLETLSVYPESQEYCLNLQLNIARKQGKKDWEYDLLLQRHRALGEKEAYLWEYLDYLKKWGKYDEAEMLVNQLMTKTPGAFSILVFRAQLAKLRRDYQLAKRLYGDLVQKFPDNPNTKVIYLQCLLDLLQFEEAEAFFEKHGEHATHLSLRLMKIQILKRQGQLEEALAYIQLLREKFSDPENLIVIYRNIIELLKIRFNHYGKGQDQLLRVAEEASKKWPQMDQFSNSLLQAYLANDLKEEAFRIIDANQQNNSIGMMRASIWKQMQEGRYQEASDTWKKLQNLHFVPHIQPIRKESLTRVDENTFSPEKEAIYVFTVARNERWRLPWFLGYYRSLGVDRFFFVDNNSDDGSLEYLQKQPDVHIFWTDESYAKNFSGVLWLNHLMEEYGNDAWCMYVDVDEAIVFPGIEQRNIRYLTEYMAQNGDEAFSGFMLDMFSFENRVRHPSEGEVDFSTDYPFFINKYYKNPALQCPFYQTRGGIRLELLNGYENQTKTPILRGGKGIKLLGSSHYISPAKISDVTGVLLHYKLTGDIAQSFEIDLTENRRIPACRNRYQKYLEALQYDTLESMRSHPNLVLYQSSQQLESLGLIKAPTSFIHEK